LDFDFFCGEGDDLWSMNDGRFSDFATAEFDKIGHICSRDVIDGSLLCVTKAYSAYFGPYDQFD
jgi:hypothetical protein